MVAVVGMAVAARKGEAVQAVAAKVVEGLAAAAREGEGWAAAAAWAAEETVSVA